MLRYDACVCPLWRKQTEWTLVHHNIWATKQHCIFYSFSCYKNTQIGSQFFVKSCCKIKHFWSQDATGLWGFERITDFRQAIFKPEALFHVSLPLERVLLTNVVWRSTGRPNCCQISIMLSAPPNPIFHELSVSACITLYWSPPSARPITQVKGWDHGDEWLLYRRVVRFACSLTVLDSGSH